MFPPSGQVGALARVACRGSDVISTSSSVKNRRLGGKWYSRERDRSIWAMPDSLVVLALRTLERDDTVTALAFSRDGEIVASASAYTITLWNVETGVALTNLVERKTGDV